MGILLFSVASHSGHVKKGQPKKAQSVPVTKLVQWELLTAALPISSFSFLAVVGGWIAAVASMGRQREVWPWGQSFPLQPTCLRSLFPRTEDVLCRPGHLLTVS